MSSDLRVFEEGSDASSARDGRGALFSSRAQPINCTMMAAVNWSPITTRCGPERGQ